MITIISVFRIRDKISNPPPRILRKLTMDSTPNTTRVIKISSRIHPEILAGTLIYRASLLKSIIGLAVRCDIHNTPYKEYNNKKKQKLFHQASYEESICSTITSLTISCASFTGSHVLKPTAPFLISLLRFAASIIFSPLTEHSTLLLLTATPSSELR